MLDEARMLVERRVPPATAARCEEIHAAGGLGPPPPGAMPDVLPPSGEASRDVVMLDASLGRHQDRCALYVPSLASHFAYSLRAAFRVHIMRLHCQLFPFWINWSAVPVVKLQASILALMSVQGRACQGQVAAPGTHLVAPTWR